MTVAKVRTARVYERYGHVSLMCLYLGMNKQRSEVGIATGRAPLRIVRLGRGQVCSGVDLAPEKRGGRYQWEVP